jgi:hypothetical protein
MNISNQNQPTFSLVQAEVPERPQLPQVFNRSITRGELEDKLVSKSCLVRHERRD